MRLPHVDAQSLVRARYTPVLMLFAVIDEMEMGARFRSCLWKEQSSLTVALALNRM